MAPVVMLTFLLGAQSAPATACSDWKSCRNLAEEAGARQDYEAFHDLSWRTMQLRHANDPDVMYMLARAQSLSGRPHDALVMLGRILDMGVATDADTSPDFARVRALAGWPELQARIENVRSGENAFPQPAAAAASDLAGPVSAKASSETGKTPAKGRRREWEEAARLKTPQFSPGGIAYDAVSRRYLVGNFPARKLTEIEEGSNRVATLSGAAAQFFDVKALEIDSRQGDLWVVSDGTAAGGAAASALHKLQLISGRVLKVFETPTGELPARFVDVAVSANGSVLVLDAAQPRIFTTASMGALQRLMALPAGSPASIAPVDGSRAAYVAYSDRLVRVDLQQRRVTPVTTARSGQFEQLERIRWYRDSLVGVQGAPDGARRVVRVPLGHGAHAGTPVVLDEWRDASGGAASAALIGDEFYYLVPGDGEAVIRRIRLR